MTNKELNKIIKSREFPALHVDYLLALNGLTYRNEHFLTDLIEEYLNGVNSIMHTLTGTVMNLDHKMIGQHSVILGLASKRLGARRLGEICQKLTALAEVNADFDSLSISLADIALEKVRVEENLRGLVSLMEDHGVAI